MEKIRREWEKLELTMEPHKKTWKIKGSDVIFAVL